MSNKSIAFQTQSILKDFGYEIKTTHLQELFARIAGFKNIHTASAKSETEQKIEQKTFPIPEEAKDIVGMIEGALWEAMNSRVSVKEKGRERARYEKPDKGVLSRAVC